MGKFKQTLLTESAYYQLKEAKEALEKLTGRKVSFTEVIRKLVGKQLVMMELDADVKNYIEAFVDKITLNRHTLGIILFGSVAKRAFTKFSDIDIAVITDADFLDYLDYLNKAIKEIENYQDRLIKKGLSLYINPLIITKKDIKKLNPIYFDIADDGIVLYQRENTVSEFFESLEKIKHKRINTASGQILTWE
ncbi:nucleotidyltransferase domain-containing protein [Candidatus Parvarchaeota archaeon]|uniref:Nucleotidyltransferase domain-containing protein n=1 Tax=Candidatus Acidifodinimicrobium mancum TaxID=2898728 RepID=A0A8T3US12_9ARCH|nr:nucleotidyltransferase domain-containing protein [Candidatus Acidifodinimicrobium mancum]